MFIKLNGKKNKTLLDLSFTEITSIVQLFKCRTSEYLRAIIFIENAFDGAFFPLSAKHTPTTQSFIKNDETRQRSLIITIFSVAGAVDA